MGWGVVSSTPPETVGLLSGEQVLTSVPLKNTASETFPSL